MLKKLKFNGSMKTYTQKFPDTPGSLEGNTEGPGTASLQSCPTMCDPIDSSPPGSSVHGILQARILEQVAMPSYRVSSPPRDCTHVSCIGRRVLHCWALWEAPGCSVFVSKANHSISR